jgi:hypothetical protein
VASSVEPASTKDATAARVIRDRVIANLHL